MEKKHFVKIAKSLVTVLFKMALYLCMYYAFTKKTIIVSLISMILTCPLKPYVIGLHNLISMNIFFTVKVIIFNSQYAQENTCVGVSFQ